MILPEDWHKPNFGKKPKPKKKYVFGNQLTLFPAQGLANNRTHEKMYVAPC